MDHSCQDFAFNPANNISDPWELCGMLSKSLPFVKSDLFVMISQRDTAISRDYGCPEPGLEDEVFVPWKEGVHRLISMINANNPRVGWFSPSCEEHVINGLPQEIRKYSLIRFRLVQCSSDVVTKYLGYQSLA